MVMSCHSHLHWSDWWSLVSHRRRIGFRRMLLGIPQASEQASRFVASGASSRRGQPVSPRSDSADLTLAMEKTEGWEGNIVVMLWKSCSLYPREVIVCCLMLFSYVFHFHLHLLSKDYHRLSCFLISSDFHVAGFMACILFISNACFASQPKCLGKWCGTLQKKQFECITVNTNRKQTQDSMTRHENIMNRKHKPKKQMKNGLVWQHENMIKKLKTPKQVDKNMELADDMKL